jgi:hypothetical protein
MDAEDVTLPASQPGRWAKLQRILVVGLGVWLLIGSSLVLAFVWSKPRLRAVIEMGFGLILIWNFAAGFVMWRWRDTWLRLAARIPANWGLKFVLGCVALAMLEEVVTTTMTNCAPLFGVKIGEAYVTASTNYWDVVIHHSVVIFVPMFIGWAVVLRIWKFSPFSVFLLWGLTGTMLEWLYSGGAGVPNFALWIFVYGLMIWLPAHFPPETRPTRDAPWWAYPVAVFVPLLFLPLDLVLAPWLWVPGLLWHTPPHPDRHFPPIGG